MLVCHFIIGNVKRRRVPLDSRAGAEGDVPQGDSDGDFRGKGKIAGGITASADAVEPVAGGGFQGAAGGVGELARLFLAVDPTGFPPSALRLAPVAVVPFSLIPEEAQRRMFTPCGIVPSQDAPFRIHIFGERSRVEAFDGDRLI